MWSSWGSSTNTLQSLTNPHGVHYAYEYVLASLTREPVLALWPAMQRSDRVFANQTVEGGTEENHQTVDIASVGCANDRRPFGSLLWRTDV
jgi:hypothetical protein